MNEYHPFSAAEITAIQEQNRVLQAEFSSAMQYIQGLSEALDDHFATLDLTKLSATEHELFDVWKLTSTKYPRQPDCVTLLWDAHDALHARFNLPRINTKTAVTLLLEEALELSDAAYGTRTPDTGHVTNEAADLLTVTLAVIGSLGIERVHFYDACKLVARKNDAKTTDTHYLNPETGKITRKAK